MNTEFKYCPDQYPKRQSGDIQIPTLVGYITINARHICQAFGTAISPFEGERHKTILDLVAAGF